MLRFRAAAAGFVIALLTLTGCATGERISFELAPTGGPGAELTPFYTQRLEWQSCGANQCASLRVPELWSAPAGNVLRLSVVKVPARGNSRGALVVNPGGPGASAVQFAIQAENAVSARVWSGYDIIGIDPRGVGGSAPIRCLDAKGMDDYLYGYLGPVRGSAAWLAKVQSQSVAFADACAKNTGSWLTTVDTVTTARDLDVLRAALGQERLNYLGYSYGTYLGERYADLFPERVGRMVLDGVIDPSISMDDMSLGQAQGFERAFRNYLSSCLEDGSCPYRGSVDGALRQVRQVLDRYQNQPPTGADGRPVSGDTLFTAIALLLYSPAGWKQMGGLLSEAEQGGTERILHWADLYNDRDNAGRYTSNTTEANIAINCLDFAVDYSVPHMRDLADRLQTVAPTFGNFFAWGDTQCSVFPGTGKGNHGPIRATGLPPIVVIGTTGDPATPYQWAENLAAALPRSQFIRFNGEGHTGYNKGNSCVTDAVDRFLVDGILPGPRTVCG